MKASNVAPSKKLSKDVPDLEEAIEEEDENDVAEVVDADEDEELDLKTDKYIKQPKAKSGKKTAKKPAKADDDEDDDGGSKTKAKGKAAATRGRGRPKKA